MPSPIAHTIINCTACLWFRNKLKLNMPYFLFFLIIGLLPDIDIGIVYVTKNVYFHRTITHSMTFALIVSLIVLFFKSHLFAIFSFALLCVHLFMDYITTDVLPPAGITLFWPLSDVYYQSPYCIFDGFDWRTVGGIFSRQMGIALIKEFAFTIIVFLGALYVYGKHKKISN